MWIVYELQITWAILLNGMGQFTTYHDPNRVTAGEMTQYDVVAKHDSSVQGELHRLV